MGRLGYRLECVLICGLVSNLAQSALAELPGMLRPTAPPPVVATHAQDLRPNSAPAETPAQITRLSAEALRSAEIAIELAWLADATTFPFPLKARTKDGKIELLGPVPSTLVRDKASALALAATTVPVSDRIVVQPRMNLHLLEQPADDFAFEAKTRLFSLGSVEGRQIELKTTKDGKLYIAGFAASADEKLAYSKVFQGLVGCKLVRNEMTIGAMPVVQVQNVEEPKVATAAVVKSSTVPPAISPPPLVVEKFEFRAVKRELPTLGPPRKASQAPRVWVDFN